MLSQMSLCSVCHAAHAKRTANEPSGKAADQSADQSPAMLLTVQKGLISMLTPHPTETPSRSAPVIQIGTRRFSLPKQRYHPQFLPAKDIFNSCCQDV